MEPLEPIDFSSDDSVVDKTFNPVDVSSEDTSSEDNDIRSKENQENEAQGMETNPQTKRNRKGTNLRKIIQQKRNNGLLYETKKGKIVQARKFQPLGNCRKKCSDKINIENQKVVFDEVWAMGNYNQRSAYLSSLILDFPKKTQRIRNTTGEPKPRSVNHKYHVKINSNLIEVCKICFIKTFGVSNKSIEVIIKKQSKRLSGIISQDKRGSSTPINKISDEMVNVIKDHINSYPLLESHYSRRHTNKKYLPAGLSLTIMYKMYKEKVTSPVSYSYFGNIFHTMGLSFKKPSLDTCNICDTYKMKIKFASTEELVGLKNELSVHHLEADTAYAMKRQDKEQCTDVKRVYSFDLQQCLPTPFLKTNIVFYKRLLWTYNLTIYDCFKSKSYCYMWHEARGGRGANQIASCLFQFLQSLPSHVKEVSLYSDTCGGQNKNSHVAAMFLCMSQIRPDLVINQKFLVPGHTHMECDSIHAQIERKKKKTDMSIHLPRDWYNLVRGTNSNINVIVMETDMFLNFADLYKGPLQVRKVDSTGNKFLWHDVKWFQFCGNNEPGTIKFKTSLDNEIEFKQISFCRRGKVNEILQPKKCYTKQVTINQDKKKDLLSILHLIDGDCHDFYRNLEDSTNTRDMDPDIEDFNARE